MTTDWIARRLEVPEGTDRVIIPGLCKGDMAVLQRKTHVPVERGRRTAVASMSGLVKNDKNRMIMVNTTLK